MGGRHHRALSVERKLRCFGTDELDAGIGEDIDLVVVRGDDPDVHQLRQFIDIGVALVEQRRRSRIGRAVERKLTIDRGDLGHRIVGARDGVAQTKFGIAAKRLDTGRHAVELLRQHLRGADRGAARGRRLRRTRQRLHRGGEFVERRLERRVGARLAVELLQPRIEIRAQTGIAAAGRFGAQLPLQIDVELAIDGADPHADAIRAGRGRLLHQRLAHIAGRFGIRHVGSDERQRGLRGAQAGGRGVECLGQTH